MPNKKKQSTPPPPPDTRNVNARGAEWQAEKLTGNRAQRGNLPGGQPKWTYEVQWRGAWKNTYEPASCLVGWEKEMHEIDQKLAMAALLPKVNPAAEALKAREAAAKQKAADVEKRRARLQRLQARRARMGDAVLDDDDDDLDADAAKDGDAELSAEGISAELAQCDEWLALRGGRRMPPSSPTSRSWHVSTSAARQARQQSSASSRKSGSPTLPSARALGRPPSPTLSSLVRMSHDHGRQSKAPQPRPTTHNGRRQAGNESLCSETVRLCV
jgi:hypothetical protein